jgi:hypothetical protein
MGTYEAMGDKTERNKYYVIYDVGMYMRSVPTHTTVIPQPLLLRPLQDLVFFLLLSSDNGPILWIGEVWGPWDIGWSAGDWGGDIGCKSVLRVVLAVGSVAKARVLEGVLGFWGLGMRGSVWVELDVPSNVCKSACWEVDSFSVGNWLPIVLNELFSVSEDVQIGGVETMWG